MKRKLLTFITLTLYIGSSTAFAQEDQTSSIIETSNIESDSLKIVAAEEQIVSDSPVVTFDSILIAADKNDAAQFSFIEAKETRRYMANFRERRSKYEFIFKSSILKPGDVLTFHYSDIVDGKEKTKAVVYKQGVSELLINNVEPIRGRYQGEVWITIKRKNEVIFDRVKVANNWFSVEE